MDNRTIQRRFGKPIPKEILEVERPANTVVYAYGKNRDRFGVKERVGCRRRGGFKGNADLHCLNPVKRN